ncbi:MAG TPA: AAA family ATPase [Syntrophorhabdus sp.]|nr:AAA family ATPase [Syntrophorhabdus sp.]
MRIRRLTVRNFRGIVTGIVDFTKNTLIVGGNNAGKSTVCEALDLVLGPERLYRRPVVNEHDFYQGKYLDGDGNPIEIRIEATLLDLSEEAERRFHNHLRRWNDKSCCWIDEEASGAQACDNPEACWSLPVIFIGRYDPKEDDFIGNTFFAHPQRPLEEIEEEEEETKLGEGLHRFTREHKRFCGFLFLRTLRTGSRALSLQRGSLLDTIMRIGEKGSHKMWQDTLDRLHDLEPQIGAIDQLKTIRDEVQTRMAQFVNLATEGESTAFYASELTRDHLREVVQFFVASEQSNHLIPFQRQGTGTINMLVFTLLTFIAELKGGKSVIFAMEEPEIALPPHTQRRVVQFVLKEMGQTIVTSHSPYVIEQFEPDQIVMLNHPTRGVLSGEPIDVQGIKVKTFKTARRQFAEAILSRAVLVVEGATEVAMFAAATTVLEKSRGMKHYAHFDLSGVTIFNAGGDGSVPRYGPVFKALDKLVFGVYDKPNSELTADAKTKLESYTAYWESPYKGVENLLSNGMPASTLRKFLESVKDREDYPSHPKPNAEMTNGEILDLAKKVLKDRKGEAHGYAALLISTCEKEEELPKIIIDILDKIQEMLAPPALVALTKDKEEYATTPEMPADKGIPLVMTEEAGLEDQPGTEA